MKRALALFLLTLFAGMAELEAHAFLQRADPAVGSTLTRAPNEIKIWFTEGVEPAFSRIQVFAPSGKEVDKKDVRVDPSNHALLQVSLPPLQPGSYKVAWRVVSVDTHVTEGSYSFRVDR